MPQGRVSDICVTGARFLSLPAQQPATVLAVVATAGMSGRTMPASRWTSCTGESDRQEHAATEVYFALGGII